MKSALALVIGNIDYTDANLKLVNAVNDAKAVARKLQRLGFTVIHRNNCTIEDFDRALAEFEQAVSQYAVGLFYYAGHGMQIHGENFLTGIDTSFFDRHSAKRTSIPLTEIIDGMNVPSLEVKIIILDACRDNPLPEMRGVSNDGLAPIYAPKGTIIAFSTSPGERAKDSGAGKHSVYTGAFLEHINDVDIPIEEFFKRVRTSVYAHSNGQQTSWEHTSLIGDFYFNSGQLTHSANLPYQPDHVADSKFVSSGSPFDEVITGMRSHDWYQQGPAFSRFCDMPLTGLHPSQLFLVGRNVLQMAIGGERATERIIEHGKLDSFLSKYFNEGENHLLNGMLFEIYFNSEGLFRETRFKNKYITELFALAKNRYYGKSFEFIAKALRPFQNHVFYMPSTNPKSFPVEVQLKKYTGDEYAPTKSVWELVSIKHNNVELLHDPYPHPSASTKITFLSKLTLALSAPRESTRVTWNHPLKDTAIIHHPWELNLSRFAPEE